MVKTLHRVVLALTVVAFAATTASAFDLGSKVKDASKDAAKAGSKKVVEDQINKDLREKNCGFKPKTSELTCDLEDILSTLKTEKTIAEKSGFADNVTIYAEVGKGKDPKNAKLGDERLELVQKELQKKINYWHWNDTTIEGDQLKLSVKIK